MSNLTFLQALLIVAHERRTSIEDAAALLRSGEEFTTFSGIFSQWRTRMYEIADRLIAAGHIERVCEAGQFATLRAETLGPHLRITDLRWSPDDEHLANELFQAISDCEDADELTDLGEYIESRLDPRPIAA